MNQIDIPDYQHHLGCNAKRMVPVTFLEKKFVFHTEISTYSLIIRLFYFHKYRNFIGSRSCSNQTKLGMEYLMGTSSLKQNKFCYSLPWKKVSISYGNIDLFAYYSLILFS